VSTKFNIAYSPGLIEVDDRFFITLRLLVDVSKELMPGSAVFVVTQVDPRETFSFVVWAFNASRSSRWFMDDTAERSQDTYSVKAESLEDLVSGQQVVGKGDTRFSLVKAFVVSDQGDSVTERDLLQEYQDRVRLTVKAERID
jgi:hypothetical protein